MVVRMAMFFILLSSAGSVSFVASQGSKAGKSRANINGVWVLDKSKSDATEYGFNFDLDIRLTIEQREPEIRITRSYFQDGAENRQQLTYFTDGRGETNPTILVGEVIKSETKWNGDKLVSKNTGQAEIAPRIAVIYERADEWRLSKDGNTLVQITRIYNARSSRGEPYLTTDHQNVPPLFSRSETKRVFRRSVQK